MIIRIIFSISVIAAISSFMMICIDKMTFLVIPGTLIRCIFYIFLIFLFLGLAICLMFPNVRKSYKYTNQLRSFFKSINDEPTDLEKLLSNIEVKVKKKNVMVRIKAPTTLKEKKEFEENEQEIISSIIEKLDPVSFSDKFYKNNKYYAMKGEEKNGR